MDLQEFYKNYICLNLNQYEGINVNFEINKFLIIALVGVIAAIIVLNIKRSAVYLTVNKLLRHEAIGKENAKSLIEMGIDIFKVRSCLSEGSQIKVYVSRVGEEKLSYEEYIERMKNKTLPSDKIDFAEEKFYIKSENVAKAREVALKSNSLLLNTILFCVLTFIVFTMLILLMPEILNVVNGMLAK